MKPLLLCNLLLASSLAHAAGKGTMMDLVPAFINLFILVAILFYVLRKPVKNYYASKSENVKNILERASVKAKEAEMMMEAQKKKIENAAGEIDGIHGETEKNIAAYKTSYAKEVDERIVKLKEDAASKIEAEKIEQINKLNSSFLDDVIAKTKRVIKNDPDLAGKATEKTLEGLNR